MGMFSQRAYMNDILRLECALYRLTFEPSHEKPYRSDTNRAVQARKMERGRKILNLESRGICTVPVAKTKALISFLVFLVFAYANC